jgi:hypothetical protein
MPVPGRTLDRPVALAATVAADTRPKLGRSRIPSPRLAPKSGRRTWLQPDQSVDLIHQSVDLGPVAAPSLVIVPRMPYVHRSSDEHRMPGHKLVELFGVHCPTGSEHRFAELAASRRHYGSGRHRRPRVPRVCQVVRSITAKARVGHTGQVPADGEGLHQWVGMVVEQVPVGVRGDPDRGAPEVT